MKKLTTLFLVAAVCLLPVVAAADTITCMPGPFRFSLPADAGTATVSLYDTDMEIAGSCNGVPYAFSLFFTSRELGVAEAWEPIIKGLHTASGKQTLAEAFTAETLYSLDYRMLKDGTLYSGSISAGCATGYMHLLCYFTKSEYATYEALLTAIRATLTIDPSIEPDDTEYVWIAGPSGKKYHSTPTCCGMKNPVRITLDEAIERGLEPCQICH